MSENYNDRKKKLESIGIKDEKEIAEASPEWLIQKAIELCKIETTKDNHVFGFSDVVS